MFKMGVRIIYNVEKSTSNWRGVLQTGEEYFKLERSTSYLKYSFPECGEEDLPILFEKGRSAFPLDKSILLIFKKCKKRRKKSETPYYMKGIKCDTNLEASGSGEFIGTPRTTFDTQLPPDPLKPP